MKQKRTPPTSRAIPFIALTLLLVGACALQAQRKQEASTSSTAGAKAAAAPRILMIVTSHDKLGSTDEKTGIWLEELTAPYREFITSGAVVTIASPGGGEVPVDPRSLDDRAESVRWFFDRAEGKKKLASALRLADVKSEYDGYFIVGGHGAMWDLPASRALSTLLSEAYEDGRVVSAVCHGPAALINVRLRSGASLLSGHRVTGFSNSEEVQVKLDGVVPFALQSKLEELGGRYESRPNFTAFAVQDGRLITGQNPASSIEVAKLVLQTIGTSKKTLH